MKLFNLKTNFWKVALIGLLFIIPTFQASATEWEGNILVNSLSSESTSEEPDFTIPGSAPNDSSRKFYITIGVTNPAVDENKNGKIDDTSEELKSWDAVEDSGVTTVDGIPYLTPTDKHQCPGGLCVQISTNSNFDKMNSLWYYFTPEVSKKVQGRSFIVKGFKPGVKYYFRFVGQESYSTDEHIFPTSQNYSFTPIGIAAPQFLVEIPQEKITKNSAELVVHMPSNDSIIVKLYEGNTQLNPPLARNGTNAASEPATGGYFHRLTTNEITLKPGTLYKVVATNVIGDSRAENFFTTLPDPTNVSVNPKPEPSVQETGEYRLLAPLPVFGEIFDVKGGLGPYLQVIFVLLIGIAGLLSVIMIVIGGIEYMSTDAISGKEEGRERVTQAVLGLIIALGSWVLLNTINPDLLSLRFKLGTQTVTQTTGVTGGGGSGGVNASYEAIKGTCKHTSHITISHFEMGAVWTGPDATVNANLQKLRTEFNKLNTATGGQLTPNSVYRTPLYQQHLYEIHGLYNELKNNSTTECKALRSWVIDEHNRQHGIGSTVAKPTSSAPHTRGIGIDIGINPGSSYTYSSLDKLAQDNIIHLRWKKIPGDDVHFELTD